MTLTDALAIVGATTGTLSLLVQFSGYRRAGPRYAASWRGPFIDNAHLRISNGPHPLTIVDVVIARGDDRPGSPRSAHHHGPVTIDPGVTRIFSVGIPPGSEPLRIWVRDGRTMKRREARHDRSLDPGGVWTMEANAEPFGAAATRALPS